MHGTLNNNRRWRNHGGGDDAQGNAKEMGVSIKGLVISDEETNLPDYYNDGGYR